MHYARREKMALAIVVAGFLSKSLVRSHYSYSGFILDYLVMKYHE